MNEKQKEEFQQAQEDWCVQQEKLCRKELLDGGEIKLNVHDGQYRIAIGHIIYDLTGNV